MYISEHPKINLSLCGDIFISKRLPSTSYPGLDKLKELLYSHECRFANLETTIHRNEGYPEAFPGGGYAMADPMCLHDLKKMGFNLFNTANNHAMDYSHMGLLATLKYLKECGIPFSGTGKNLAEATRPAFFESSGGRIALIGVTSSFHDSYAAGAQNQDMQGRPGVAPLRHRAIYELNGVDYEALLNISKSIGINHYHNQAVKEGYLIGSKNLKFGVYEFKKGTTNQVSTIPHEVDLQRTVDTIKDIKHQSDLIIVSVHSHQFENNDKRVSSGFIKIFARQCIEAGADIIVCHGPHLLRGIEIYQSGIIFHGLGNFIFQHEDVELLPEEFYRKYGKTRETVTGVGEIMNLRSKNGMVGLCASPEAWRSMVVSLVCYPSYLGVKLYPIEIMLANAKGLKGLPVLSTDRSILEEVKKISADLGTEIEISSENVGLIRIDR